MPSSVTSTLKFFSVEVDDGVEFTQKLWCLDGIEEKRIADGVCIQAMKPSKEIPYVVLKIMVSLFDGNKNFHSCSADVCVEKVVSAEAESGADHAEVAVSRWRGQGRCSSPRLSVRRRRRLLSLDLLFHNVKSCVSGKLHREFIVRIEDLKREGFILFANEADASDRHPDVFLLQKEAPGRASISVRF